MNPTETDELTQLIASLREREHDMTIVMVEHKLQVVRQLARRCVVMNQGAVLIDAPSAEALDHPSVIEAYLGTRRTAAAYGRMTVRVAEATDAASRADPDAWSTCSTARCRRCSTSISVAEGGEVVVVLGGNASGKSTTIKSVLGLVDVRSGEVHFDGARVDGVAPHHMIRKGIGSIPEGRRMFSEMTVLENLTLGAYACRDEPKAEIGRRIEEAFTMFPRLAQRQSQLAGTLSGGEQQMLAMGRAWMRRPRLLCIDEPSMGLSPLFVDQVYEILAEWKKQGMTILMVEQNANMALTIADRGYVLKAGHVVISGLAAELLGSEEVQRAYLGG